MELTVPHPRYVCIHGHFYQPPRENPWLGIVEVQDSAAPFHDWNERITHECYAPNTRARLVDGEGRIINLLNNYAWISFNFGPTLLHWMQDAAPEVMQGIVEADRLSQERRRGHGNALAQVYNHVIMPLASPRDRQTQVLWGIADFRHRFGREPEGMWLAETAADVDTLEVLAEAGVHYTILAPRQARRWRKLGEKSWVEIPDGIDPSCAYLCRLPSGRSIVLFFYDGIISRQVAFERLLDHGDRFLARLFQGFDPRRDHPQLMHIATDGESYGHHHAHGDMALAYVLERLSHDQDVRLTNYGEFLELHPPRWEVEIHEKSSWSCVHGVERWRSDCGCRTRGDWHQKWRGPLRAALDALKEQLDHLFSTRGRECFPNPWIARDAFIDVILRREQAETVPDFLKKHGHPDLDQEQTRDALRLLEMQQDAMHMFTSCGWFFDEISGLETVQCLHYAARAIWLARLFGREFEPEFIEALALAPSNLTRFGDGSGVWSMTVRPTVVDLDRVLAHHAISLIYRPTDESLDRVYSYDLEVLDHEVRSRGSGHLAVGRLRAQSRRTFSQAETCFVVVHFGGLDFHAVLVDDMDIEAYEPFKVRLLATYRAGSLADVLSLVDSEFPGKSHRLDDLFKDEQRRIIGIVLADRFEDYQRAFEQLANQDEEVLNRLGQLSYPIPKPLRAAASAYLDHHLEREIDRLAQGEETSLAAIEHLHERGRAWGYRPERAILEKLVAESLVRTLREIRPAADLGAITSRAERLLDACVLLEIKPDLWQAQNQFLEAYLELSISSAMTAPLRQTFTELCTRLNVSPKLLGWRP
jgi:alpha-amylase/alpha-mannosidase (GH57 family)